MYDITIVGGTTIASIIILMVIAMVYIEYQLVDCKNYLEDNIDKNKLLKALQEYYKEEISLLKIESLSGKFKVPEFMVMECVKELVKEKKCSYNKKEQTVIITGFGLKEN